MVKNKNILFKAQRRLKVGICHTNHKTKVATGYLCSPSPPLKGNWLEEAGFDTRRGVTVKIS
ncbi:TPA: SymE family type I addiction module toxin [Salmonella enterica]|nr:SymE family type I addiction module toxin [Salmonella enterica]